ncbi:Rha family transcriptional regulator [Campylobacter jejuni]|uniref:Rha family transcriptional regulator n=2 Tax=Campylobacter coli TaxID=195 RepID=UPI00042F2F26|nr:Rha family transcriptional regulator [Campylobacter coli]EAJ4889899.1 phage regulatory protein [Campylobacter jejuni]AHK73626.1 antirepressor [Campylobacter coli RM1875]EAH8332842.1 phage regulatory protein [Campylobacter coli]EAJ3725059.1 phage regulatory protein [Campylobacter coli]EAJ4484960.1 phage regulatory protein [Campylobacter coli]
MNNVVFINNQEVVFENKDEQVFCTSLDVAKVFGKQHKHILELIGEKFNNNEIKNFCEPNFRLSFKTRKIEGFRGKERKYPYYQLTKDGFSFIAMGLTGRKADKFKIEFINAFNEMKNIIRSNNQTTNYSDYEFIKKQNEILNQITCTQSSTIYVLQDSIRFLNNTISSMKEINKELKKIAGIDRFL